MGGTAHIDIGSPDGPCSWLCPKGTSAAPPAALTVAPSLAYPVTGHRMAPMLHSHLTDTVVPTHLISCGLSRLAEE